MKNNGLKHWYQKRAITNALKSNKREKVFPKIGSIKEIAIISDHDVDKNTIQSLFGIQVRLQELKFIPTKRDKGDDSPGIFVSDINFFGVPASKLIETFVNTPFDILIDFTREKSGVVEFVCAKSVAKFKVGKHNTNSIFDLIINKPDLEEGKYSKVIVETLSNFS